ncbi:UNVERIFIED_CONTAM: Retrovirus-related Pol polyprotein from transposon.6 [Sesamum latifolium]|uniref:Retrovirus-related Pol polyprotein from transposon.6 n=1 Tax=Sesamum latifolium TaxID=2727402 RepID=A0AAW2XFI4_9LAMI
MYVRVQVNGKEVMAILDTGTTHNFVADREIQKLGLTLAQHSSRIKAVNSEAKPIQGVASVDLKGIYLQDSVRSAEKNDTLISALQVKNGRHGEPTYLAALIEIKSDVVQEVPDEVAEVLEEFKDVFSPELPKKLPPRRAIDHAIELESGARLPAQAPYRMGPAELAELKIQLDGLLEVTIKNMYPIPNAMHLFDKLTKARYYTKIDLRSGYWQVRVARGGESKTTCVTRYGSFEFLVMPFGLTNALATFCNLMHDILYEFLDRFVVVYLDDIVVYSESLIDHVRHLRAVFQKLREYELYAKKEKCEFCCEQITFLGHVISQGKIQMDSRKVKAVIDWGIPSKVTDLRSFLGLANYYKRFIKGYSKIVNPLTDLLKKDQKWEWTVACDDAFRLLKLAISTQPVLQLPQFDIPFERKLSPKQARWQEFLGEFDFEWVHRLGKHNDVTDALSRKMVEEYVAALTVVESDLLDQICESSKMDAGYMKLVELVKNGQIKKYWLDSGLLCQRWTGVCANRTVTQTSVERNP